jgi:radical SAM superfamily enzyme YgiQ (UPF0313 family)
MRIIHIDTPRSLTTTIKPFDFDAATYLDTVGITYDSIDINIAFWQFLFSKVGSKLNIGKHLFYPASSSDSLRELDNVLEEINTTLNIPLSAFGFSFDDCIVTSTREIREFCENFSASKLIHEFVESILKEVLYADEVPQVITLGIDSNQSLTFAALLATVLRQFVPPQVKIGIGKHSYENFSLTFWREKLEKSKNLNSIFDFLIYEEEYFKESLVKLCDCSPRIDQAVRVSYEPENHAKEDFNSLVAKYKTLIEKSHYQKFWDIPPQNLVYLMPLSRNKCYWKRCTFCVQINKHLEDRFYSEESEITVALASLQAVYDLGIRYIIFNDEAATPKNIAALCQFLEAEHIGDLQWTVRIIADKNFRASLIERMAKMGCREVLFGLETVLPSTAQRMGKVSSTASEEQLMALLSHFGHRGIGIFLNLIYAFPTESDSDFLTSFRFYQRAKAQVPGITVQFNKFALFYGSAIFRSPEQYDLTIVPAEPDCDLQLIFDYIDKFGRRYSDARNQDYFFESLDVDESELDAIQDESLLELLFQISYASFGFIYKCQTNQNLMRHVLTNRQITRV